jgi:hypothetical protein
MPFLRMVRGGSQICKHQLLSMGLVTATFGLGGHKHCLHLFHDFRILEFQNPAAACLIVHIGVAEIDGVILG